MEIAGKIVSALSLWKECQMMIVNVTSRDTQTFLFIKAQGLTTEKLAWPKVVLKLVQLI